MGALRCADIGHLATDWPVHMRWVRRLEAEMFAQGDQEKALGLKVSFLMDRGKPGVSESQLSFFNYVALPLFNVLAEAFPLTAPFLCMATNNFKKWCKVEESLT